MTTTQKTCFWALLSTSNLAFVYLSSSLRNTSTSDKSILGTCLYDYLHPNEYVPAKRDISRSIEQRDLLGSVTRCRFRNIFLSRPLIRSRRKASVAVPSQPDYQGTHQATLPPIPTPPTHSRSPRSYFGSVAPNPHCDRNESHNTNAPDYDEEEYLVMDIALNVLCDGVVLGIFHPIDDEQREHVCGQQSYDSQDIEHWNQCVRYLSEQNRQLGTSGNHTGVPLTPNTPQSPSSKITSLNSFGTSLSTNATHSNYCRIFFILDSSTLSPLLCWPEEAFCKLTGAQKVPPPGSRGVLEHHLKPEDLRKIKEHLEKPAPSDDRLCIQRYSAKHSLTHMDGSVQYVQCIVIPYGSITFACFQSVAPLLSNFAAQQPLQLSLPPGKRHYTPLNKKVLDNNPVTSFTSPSGTSSVSRLLNHPYTSVPGMPLTPGSPSAQGNSQNPLECSIPEENPNIYSKSSYSYYPRNSHNRASLPSLPTLRNKVSDPNFNANRRASEPHTNFARPRDKTNSIMSSSSLSRIPENQVSVPSPLSPNKRAFKEAGGPLCPAPIKKFRSEQEDLRVRVLGRNYSEGDIFRPMDHPGSHRRHSSPVTHRDQPQAKGSLPPISQLVEPQTHHPSNGLSYSQSSHPHIMSTPVGVHPQAMNQFRPSTSGIHASPSTQGYAMTRGGVPISFLHSSASVQKRCESCNTSQSPEWRRGPTGHKTLCNACGLRYSRSIARAGKQQQKANAANVTPTSNSNTTRSIPNFTISTPSHSRQSISKSDAYIERTSVHHYPVSHLSYPHSAHIPSTLPSSSGNSRGNR